MTEDIYFKLDERLNENPIKWPLEDTFLWCQLGLDEEGLEACHGSAQRG
jgi:hypothetical protein